jgi:hypothetical protein
MNLIQTFYLSPRKRVITDLFRFNLLLLSYSNYKSRGIFPKTKLYCDEFTESIVKKITNFDEYVVVDSNKYSKLYESPFFYAIQKLYTYIDQQEPFIHIDHDLFINDYNVFNKVIDKDFILGRFEFEKDYFPIGRLDVFNTLYGPNYYKIKQNDFFDKSVYDNCFIDKIINASVFGGNNYEEIKETYSFILDVFEKNIKFFKVTQYCSLFLEQLMFFPVLNKVTNKKYIDKNQFEHSFGVLGDEVYEKEITHLNDLKDNLNFRNEIIERIREEIPEQYKIIYNE